MNKDNWPAAVIEQDGELIAFGTTQNSGVMARALGRSRWSEVGVWFLHNPVMGGKRWACRVSGMTAVEGEHNRHNILWSGTLERALKLVDQTGEMGIAVAETAREWAEDNRVTIENARGGLIAFDSDQAALDWLYGQPDEGHSSYATMLARDTGAGASTVRMQINGGRDVMVPLRRILPFIDRGAFRRARAAGETARG